MIKRLLLKCNEDIDRDRWDRPDDTYLSLCKTGVRHYFDVPESAPEIVLCASDQSVPGATRASVRPETNWENCFYTLTFEGAEPESPIIFAEVGEWFPGEPGDDFWFWIEY